MNKLSKVMEYIRKLCCICWNDHSACEESDMHRLSHMREAKERVCDCSCPEHVKHTLKRIFPLHRHLNLDSGNTKVACNHWLWRGQEEYLEWKQQGAPEPANPNSKDNANGELRPVDYHDHKLAV